MGKRFKTVNIYNNKIKHILINLLQRNFCPLHALQPYCAINGYIIQNGFTTFGD